MIDYTSTGVEIIGHPPSQDGYRFPAEWERHERTLMQFLPLKPYYATGADEEWAAVANAVTEFEAVTMAVAPETTSRARRILSTDIELNEWPMDDGWCRDSGPMILVNGTRERRVAGFEFNGWGAKFPPFSNDALIKARLAAHLGMAMHPVDFVLEGGAVTVDGEGTLITTEQCLLHSNRNPSKSKSEIEAVLRDWLGVEKIIWLPKGLEPDPVTDGHVDGIAAFSGPAQVLVHVADESDGQNHALTIAARDILRTATDAKGRPLEVIEIPLTSADISHMNFYICNGGVIVPVAGTAKDDEVPIGILREVFPDRKIVPIPARRIAQGGGGVHCITQQVPAV